MTLFDTYSQNVEMEFIQFQERYSLTKKSQTGVESVLQFLLDHPERIWWWSWEFVGKNNSKGGYLSHRAPARASDLALHEPELVEDRRIGRFKVYRLRRENIDKINNRLS